MIAETRIKQVIVNNVPTVKQLSVDYVPLNPTGTLTLTENKSERRIDVLLNMTNIDDTYIYVGVVNKYAYDIYTYDVVTNILESPDFSGTLTETTAFFVQDPFSIPEQDPDAPPSSFYYFTIFAISTTTNEYIRFVEEVEYQSLPIVSIEQTRTNRDEYAIYVDMDIQNIYDDYQYEYAARVTKEILSDDVITADTFVTEVFTTPDMYGLFEIASNKGTGYVNPNNIDGPVGSTYYIYLFVRAKDDSYLISEMVTSQVEYVGQPIIEDVHVVISHILYDEPPNVETISVELSENELTYDEYIQANEDPIYT